MQVLFFVRSVGVGPDGYYWGECREMADVERDVLNVNWLPAFADRERREIHSEQSIELPGPLDMAIIGIAGLASVTLVMLGLWKFVELVA